MGFSSLSAAASACLRQSFWPTRRNRRKPTFHCNHCSKSLQLEMALSRQLMLNIVDRYIHKSTSLQCCNHRPLFIHCGHNLRSNWSLHKNEELSNKSVHSSFMYIHAPFLRLLCTPFSKDIRKQFPEKSAVNAMTRWLSSLRRQVHTYIFIRAFRLRFVACFLHGVQNNLKHIVPHAV